MLYGFYFDPTYILIIIGKRQKKILLLEKITCIN